MTKFRIIADSGCDISNEIVEKEDIKIVPLIIDVNNKTFIDNNIDTKDLISNILEDPNPGKSSCPSPQAYLNNFGDAKEIFIVTLSSSISGSYNSACLAKELYLDTNPDAKVHIVDSNSASACETLLVHKLIESRNHEHSFEETVEIIESTVKNTKTYFILDDMSTLIKNGRIKGLKAFLVNHLNIKAIMTQKNGEIVQAAMGHGITKAINNLAEIIKKDISMKSIKNLHISHVHAGDKVDIFLDYLKSINCFDKFSNIVIDSTRGLSTFYANNGGIIISF